MPRQSICRGLASSKAHALITEGDGATWLCVQTGGVLNHKYAGEWAVRGAGVPFAVVRSTGEPVLPLLVPCYEYMPLLPRRCCMHGAGAPLSRCLHVKQGCLDSSQRRLRNGIFAVPGEVCKD